ncbi:hypothetical protein AKJ50_00755, partial [candidate division MSBL1 archaeon SCGC-AAA382A13]
PATATARKQAEKLCRLPEGGAAASGEHGSKTPASIFNADSRIMYRIGVDAKEINLIEGEIVVGIPISATGKNIYFDREK